MTRLSRRAVLAGGAAALAPLPAAAQQAGLPARPEVGEVAFAARMRALAGFDPLPQPLVAGLYEAARETGELAAMVEETGRPNAAQARALKALYHGIWTGPGDEAEPRRIAFADALQWAAVEETNNVVSYCGGVPGFWADPPETRA